MGLKHLWTNEGVSWWKHFLIRWRSTRVPKHAEKGIFSTRNPGISEALVDIIKCNEKLHHFQH